MRRPLHRSSMASRSSRARGVAPSGTATTGSASSIASCFRDAFRLDAPLEHIHACTHRRTLTRTLTHARTHTRTHTHARLCIHAHACTQVRLPPLRSRALSWRRICRPHLWRQEQRLGAVTLGRRLGHRLGRRHVVRPNTSVWGWYTLGIH